MRTLRARLLAIGSAVALLATPLAMTSAEAEPPGKPVTVMSRNIYLGADINRPVVAATTAEAEGKSAQEIVFALARATHVTREIVDDTNFPVRAELLADEIARTKPDLVGLQEVALWRSGPLQLGAVGVPNAVLLGFLWVVLRTVGGCRSCWPRRLQARPSRLKGAPPCYATAFGRP
jgi:hypothetical protein